MKRMKEEVQSTCENCGTTYLKYRPDQKFCKPICRQRYFWKTLKEKAANRIGQNSGALLIYFPLFKRSRCELLGYSIRFLRVGCNVFHEI